ncbi:hypothetical protein ACKKBG_A02550 [Auxenochlorella protothecoides x Auxenochlorella symbiontica]
MRWLCKECVAQIGLRPHRTLWSAVQRAHPEDNQLLDRTVVPCYPSGDQISDDMPCPRHAYCSAPVSGSITCSVGVVTGRHSLSSQPTTCDTEHIGESTIIPHKPNPWSEYTPLQHSLTILQRPSPSPS